jgi:hypothetical protein
MNRNAVVVRPIRFTDHLPHMRGFLETLDPITDSMEALGLTARPGDDGLHVYGGHTGLVGPHSPLPEGTIISGPGAVQLGFETQEPLPELADRLIRAGHRDAAIGAGELGDALRVTDPDAQLVLVRPASA